MIRISCEQFAECALLLENVNVISLRTFIGYDKVKWNVFDTFIYFQLEIYFSVMFHCNILRVLTSMNNQNAIAAVND